MQHEKILKSGEYLMNVMNERLRTFENTNRGAVFSFSAFIIHSWKFCNTKLIIQILYKHDRLKCKATWKGNVRNSFFNKNTAESSPSVFARRNFLLKLRVTLHVYSRTSLFAKRFLWSKSHVYHKLYHFQIFHFSRQS